jgi:VanZ family protein
LTPARRALAWAVLGVAAFTVYGSLVPFQFRALTVSRAWNFFLTILSAGPEIHSRSDSAANVLLGIPLGFALLGLVSADRNWSRRKQAAFGLLLLPACVLFATGVEFAQLFTRNRHCTAADVVAQSLGAAAGMAAWVLGGQRITDRALAVWNRADLNAAGRILIAYLALLAFIETLPFDVTVSPADLYRKFRNHDTEKGVRCVPFSEFDGVTDVQRWKQTGKLAKLAGLFFPVGLLAARLKGRTESWSILRVAPAAIALAACMEAPQLVIQSRSPSATDALVGAFAVVMGWYAGRIHHEGLALPFVVSWGVIWLAGMTPASLPPPGSPRLESPRPFDWMPGLPLESGDPLHALEEMLTKLVLFGLLGVLVAAWRLPPRTRRGRGGSVGVAVAVAALLGLLASGLFESNQRWYDTHTPCITDVLLGGLGAALGVLVASRLRQPVRGEVSPQPLKK